MALEDDIRNLTAAVNALRAAILGGEDAAPAEPAPAPKGGKAKAEEPAKPATGKPKATKPKEITEEDMREKFGAYLALAESKAETKRLSATLRPITDFFQVERVSQIPAEHRQEALGYLKLLIDAVTQGGLEAAEAVDLGLSNETEEEEEDEDNGL